ncbi:MAG: hypothetical protein RXR08_13795 [Sulfolobaceae archaeon]
MSNVFGMDIRRFSVLFIAIIIILSFLASFANLKVPQNTSTIQIGSGGGQNYKYNFNSEINTYTVTLTPSLQSMNHINASDVFQEPDGGTLFELNNGSTTLFDAFKYLIQLNATEITPAAYSKLLAILAALCPQYYYSYIYSYIDLVPPNINNTYNMTNYQIKVNYPYIFNWPVSYKRALEAIFPKGVSITYNNTNNSYIYHVFLYDNFTNQNIELNYSVPYDTALENTSLTFYYKNQIRTLATITIHYNPLSNVTNKTELIRFYTTIYKTNISDHGLIYKAWTLYNTSVITVYGTIFPVTTYPSWFSYPPSMRVYNIFQFDIVNGTNYTEVTMAYIPINVSVSMHSSCIVEKSKKWTTYIQILTLDYDVTYYNNFTFNKVSIQYAVTLNAKNLYYAGSYSSGNSNYTANYGSNACEWIDYKDHENGYYFSNPSAYVQPQTLIFGKSYTELETPCSDVVFNYVYKNVKVIYHTYYDFVIFYAFVYNGTDPQVCPQFSMPFNYTFFPKNHKYDGIYYFFNGSQLIHKENVTFTFTPYVYDYLGIFYRHYTGAIVNSIAARDLVQLNSSTFCLNTTFELHYKTFPPPSWIFQPLTPEPIQYIQMWYYLLENLTIAHFLMKVATTGQTTTVKPLYLFKLNITHVNNIKLMDVFKEGYYMFFRVYFFNNLTLAFNYTTFKIFLLNFTSYNITVDGEKVEVQMYNLSNLTHVFKTPFNCYTSGNYTVWSNGYITLKFADNSTFYKFPPTVLNYYKFEYFALVSEFSSKNLIEFIELSSYNLTWNIFDVQRYNFTLQKYVPYEIGIVNISSAPLFFLNSTSYFNVSGNYIVYVIDPTYSTAFGNCFTFNNINIYLYAGHVFPEKSEEISLEQGFFIPEVAWATIAPYKTYNTQIISVYQPPSS